MGEWTAILMAVRETVVQYCEVIMVALSGHRRCGLAGRSGLYFVRSSRLVLQVEEARYTGSNRTGCKWKDEVHCDGIEVENA